MSIFVDAFVKSDGFGKLIFFSLIALSFLSWFVLIYKMLEIKRSETTSKEFARALKESNQAVLEFNMQHRHEKGPYKALYQDIRKTTIDLIERNRFLTKDADSAFLSKEDIFLINERIDGLIMDKMKDLEQHLFVLSTSISLAPFLGILGTVWGLLISLSGLQAGGTALSNQTVMGGLSTALATTVIGLLIAIPALIGYNFLKTKLRDYSLDMTRFASQVINTVEIEYRRV